MVTGETGDGFVGRHVEGEGLARIVGKSLLVYLVGRFPGGVEPSKCRGIILSPTLDMKKVKTHNHRNSSEEYAGPHCQYGIRGPLS